MMIQCTEDKNFQENFMKEEHTYDKTVVESLKVWFDQKQLTYKTRAK